MATFTDILGFIRQDTGENPLVWGDALETGLIDLCDEAVAGRADVNVAAGSVTLTDDAAVTNQARNMILRFTGAPVLPLDVIVPKKQKLYVFDNQSGQIVTVKTSDGIGAAIVDQEIVICVVDPDLNQVLKMVLHDQNAFIENTGTRITIPSTVGSAAVDPLPNFYWIVEGTILTMGFDAMSFTTTVAAVIVVNPISGFYPSQTKPLATKLVNVRVNGVSEPWFMNVGALGTFFGRKSAISLFPASVIVIPRTTSYSWSVAPN